MPTYMTRFRYAQPQFRALVENPQDRTAAAKQLVQDFGGTLHQFFYAFGEYDGLLIAEFPEEEAGVACLMALAASGTVSALETTVLIAPDKAAESMRRAGSVKTGYRPPTG